MAAVGLRIELAAGEIIQKEQRLGALHHEVVDRHRHQIDADAAMQAGLDRDLELGADAVGGGDQNRILEARRLEVEQPAETADLGVGAGAGGGAHHRLDQIDQTIAGVDIDARIRVSEPVFAVDHGLVPDDGGLVTSDSAPAQWLASGAAYILCRGQPAWTAKSRIICKKSGR